MSNCLLGVDELPAAGEKAEGKTLAHQLKVDPPTSAEGYFSAFRTHILLLLVVLQFSPMERNQFSEKI